nr:RusA family crossover junction endodeoxyribonuclease [Enterovirga sp. DB1703]
MTFAVRGIPASVQASARSRARWRDSVRVAALAKLPPGSWAWTTQLRVTIIYFSQGPSALDADNIAKPILDALNGLIWVDDRQIDEIVIRKSDLTALVAMKNPPPELADALLWNDAFVLVRVDAGIDHQELP